MRVLGEGSNVASPEAKTSLHFRCQQLKWLFLEPGTEIPVAWVWVWLPPTGSCSCLGQPMAVLSGQKYALGCDHRVVYGVFGCCPGKMVLRKPRNLPVERSLIWLSHELGSQAKASALWEQDLRVPAEPIHISKTEQGGSSPRAAVAPGSIRPLSQNHRVSLAYNQKRKL